ncbi:MAG: orotate phosphoribosyltransferase [Candidatus Bathyarchaeota archaeon]|nr:MAG: orotate phosphoribosyltransferase [Candidatus Bathyarchaeota archaeon]
MTPNREVVKEQLCKILYKIGALKFGTFKLTSGKISPYYIDLRVVPSFPDAFRRICDLYIQLIKDRIGTENFKRIAGIPTAGMPFASVVAYQLNKPFLYPRPSERTHGRERKVEGILVAGDKVLLLDDLVTAGTSLLKAASAIRAEGGVINDAVVLIYREEGGEGKLAKKSIKLHYLLKAGEAANALHSIGAITDMEMKTILKQRKEN